MEDFTKFICFQMGSATRKIQKFYNNLYREHGITIGQSFILFSLMQKDGQKLGALAEHLELDNSAITGLVDRMEKEMLLQRRVDPDDRRAFKIYLTSKGNELAHKIYPLALNFNTQLKEALGPEAQNNLGLVFAKIHQLIS